jgi:hypothetical protein
MRRLGAALTKVIVSEYGTHEFLRRMSDPFFFQALGCTLGFDWHSSGLTTTVCGALKEANLKDLGIAVCGGKGSVSKKTPGEIQEAADVFSLSSKKIEGLRYASRMAAKTDNVCIQDGYQLYHHCFVLSEDGDWAVIQQGMNDRLARRYHWLSDGVESFVEEPHSGIASDRFENQVMDMTAAESEDSRKASLDLVLDDPDRLRAYAKGEQVSIDEYLPGRQEMQVLVMPTPHAITELTDRTITALTKAYELQPENYEQLVAIRGIGPRAVRALALVSDLVFGKPPSWKDPARYSFAHGGKDGIPFPVDRATYEKTIETIESATEAAEIGRREKLTAIIRLREFLQPKLARETVDSLCRSVQLVERTDFLSELVF